MDLNVAWDHSSDLNVTGTGIGNDNALVFGIKKTFALDR